MSVDEASASSKSENRVQQLVQRVLGRFRRRNVNGSLQEQQLSQESDKDSNGFVKLDKPSDLLADLGTSVPPPPTYEMDITPSDDVAPPIGEDLSDFASSPLEAASGMASGAQQSLEDFLGGTGEPTHHQPEPTRESPLLDYSPHESPQHYPVHQEEHAHHIDEGISPSGDSGHDVLSDFAAPPSQDSPSDYSDEHLIDRPRAQEPEEPTYQREGPLTFGQPQQSPTALSDEFEFLASHPSAPPAHLDEPKLPEPVLEYEYDKADSPVYTKPVIEERPPTPPKPQEIPYQREPEKTHVSSGGDTESCQGPWFNFKSIDPRVLDLIYWRDPKKSAFVFGGTLALLICLATLSLISVIGYAGLAILAVTVTFRVYKMAMAQIQKGPQTNPFQPYLEKDLQLPQDRVHQQVDILMEHAQCIVKQLRRLFLIEDFVETAKFGVLLFTLTRVGAWFSGMTLVILAFIGLFTIPKFYEVYKEPIDKHMGVAHGHIKKVTDQVQEKVPFLKKKTQ